MTSRERFEAWYYQREGKPPSAAHDAIDAAAWTAWQAAEAATARRCAEICRAANTKSEVTWVCESDIRAEYPEAWK